MRRARSKYIAEVIDADVTGHRPYIVTRYVAGRPLDEIVKDDGPLGLPALVKIAHGVATALAAVHAVGVIHRDLKPGNVLILDGEPVLIDFGIAQAVDATRLTQTGMFIGTPGYLAPEIIEGQEAGPEVDIHAWAGTLLFAATGQPPFGKGTLEMIFYNITAGKADVGAAPKELQPLLQGGLPAQPRQAAQGGRAGRADRQDAAQAAGQRARRDLDRAPVRPLQPVDRAADGAAAGRQAVVRHLDAAHDAAPARRRPAAPAAPASGPAASGPATPGARPELAAPGPAAPAAAAGAAVRLVAPQQQGDPYPTRRVTPEELPRRSARPPRSRGRSPRRTTISRAAISRAAAICRRGPTADVPTRRVRPDSPDVPTRRVRPEAPDYGRGNPIQPPPYIPVQGQFPPDPQAKREPYLPHEAQTRRDAYGQPDLRTKREPFIPAARPGQVLQRSRAYGLASAMLLILMVMVAVVAPVLVGLLVLPAVVLLRAADLAQPELVARRSTGSAALDVVGCSRSPKNWPSQWGSRSRCSSTRLSLGYR